MTFCTQESEGNLLQQELYISGFSVEEISSSMSD